MLGNFLRQPSADSVTLETAGLLLGDAKLRSARDGGGLSHSAGKQAKKIERVLAEEGGLLDDDVKAFLTKAHRAFSQLEELPGALADDTATSVFPDGAVVVVQRPNPEWKAKFTELKDALSADADAVVGRLTKAGTDHSWSGGSPKQNAATRLFSKFLGSPEPNAVAMEAAGYILGQEKLSTIADGTGANKSATKMAKRIDKVLQGSGNSMDPTVRQFLGMSRNAFLHLGEMKSAVPTGKFEGWGESTIEVHKPDPAWQRKLEHIQSSLSQQAEAVVARVGAEPKPAEIRERLRADADRPVVGL